ncbi:PorV/PorQ family protein [Elusimicrobiota bacterium]
MRTTKLAILLGLALCAAQPCRAGPGAEPLNFLFLDADARPVGMGGAYTALAADANALLYNPAGLARVKRHETTFMHNEHFQGVAQEYLAFAAKQGWGVNLNYLRFGEVPRTTISMPDGTGENASLVDTALGAGYGRAILPGLSAGVGAKWIRETIAGVSATVLAFDAGAMFDVNAVNGLSLGMCVQNMGQTVRYQHAQENLPLNVRTGAGYRFPLRGQDSTISVDVMKERSEGPVVAVGAETVVAKSMPIRLGYNTRSDTGPGVTVGVGWLWRGDRIDYAFVPFGDLGSSHRVSVTWKWGQRR